MYNQIVPQEACDYGLFKFGTYWIYQDSVSHRVDSAYVIQSSVGSVYVDPAPGQHPDGWNFGGSFGYFDCVNYHTFDGGHYDFSVHRLQNPPTDLVTISRSNGGTGNSFPIPFQLNVAYEEWQGVNDSIVFVSNTSTYLLNGNLLSNVVVETDAHDQLAKKAKTRTFLKRNYGVVRKEIPASNQVWNLIRCHIVQ